MGLTRPDTKALCVTCHEDKAKQIDPPKCRIRGIRRVLDSHNPHASRRQIQRRTHEYLLGCHNDIDELRKKSVHHRPAFAQGCSTCHGLMVMTDGPAAG